MTPGPDADDDAVSPDELGFAGCVAELDRIVRGLETDAIDVDHLAATVERATTLVEWCRQKLGETRIRLDEVLPRLEVDDSEAPGDPRDRVPDPAPGEG